MLPKAGGVQSLKGIANYSRATLADEITDSSTGLLELKSKPQYLLVV